MNVLLSAFEALGRVLIITSTLHWPIVHLHLIVYHL